MRTLMIAVRRNYAWLLAAIGGAVARSMFRDVEKRGQTEHVHGMEFVGRSPEEVHLLIQAWNLLSVAAQAAQRVRSWLRRITVYDDPIRRKHFCDGTLFIRNGKRLPANRIAAYLYRIALENMLFRKWGLREVAIDDPRCLAMAYRRELALMKALACAPEYIDEEHVFIKQCVAQISRRDGRRAEVLRHRFHLNN